MTESSIFYLLNVDSLDVFFVKRINNIIGACLKNTSLENPIDKSDKKRSRIVTRFGAHMPL